MKKHWILMLAIIAIVFVCASCNSPENSDHETTSQTDIADNGTTSSSHTHSPVADPAVTATCKTTGLTAGSHCSVCNEILTKQEVIPVTEDHSPVADPAVAATCKTTGLTAGSHCSVCSKVLLPQEVTNPIDHTFAMQNTTYQCASCDLEVLAYGNADGSIAGGNSNVKYYVTGTLVHQTDGDFYTDYEIVIYGSGDMPNFSQTSYPLWHDYLPEAKKITVTSGITSIGNYAFYYHDTVENACDFEMADTVKTINSYAINLKINNLTLSHNLETIRPNAIAADKINFVYLPKTLTQMCNSILLNTTCVYEGTLEQFYQINLTVYSTNKTVKEYLNTLEDWLVSNIHIYVQANSISDLSQYWK